MNPKPPSKGGGIPTRDDSKTDRFTFTIPIKIYKKFKERCAAQDVPMSRVVTALIVEYLERENEAIPGPKHFS